MKRNKLAFRNRVGQDFGMLIKATQKPAKIKNSYLRLFGSLNPVLLVKALGFLRNRHISQLLPFYFRGFISP